MEEQLGGGRSFRMPRTEKFGCTWYEYIWGVVLAFFVCLYDIRLLGRPSQFHLRHVARVHVDIYGVVDYCGSLQCFI